MNILLKCVDLALVAFTRHHPSFGMHDACFYVRRAGLNRNE